MRKQKKPAFLFYPSDFLLECSLMSDEEIGKYVKVFCNFHYHGHLSQGEIDRLCGGHYDKIFKNLTKDENGLYYYLRMDNDKEKHTTYVDGRMKNLSGGKKAAKGQKMESSFDADDYYAAALARSNEYYKNNNANNTQAAE